MAKQSVKKLKIMIQGYWGSNDPTKAGFPFDHANALAGAGHEVRIFLIGEAVYLMRRSIAEATVPVGWPPVYVVMKKAFAKGVQIYACHPCSKVRGITKKDLAPFKAKFGDPKVFVELVEWADKILTL